MKNVSAEKQTARSPLLQSDHGVAQAIDNACFLDDAFSRVVLKNCSEEQLIEIVKAILLTIIGEENFSIVRVTAQKDLKELYSHSAVMDILAEDSNGQLYNIELQMSAPLSFGRLETYGSVLIKAGLRPGEDYSQLRHSYVVFLTNQSTWSDTGEEIFTDAPIQQFEMAKS